jgi:uncharacterized protein
MSQVAESLAGRTAVLKLMPLTRRETARITDDRLPWENLPAPSLPSKSPIELWNQILIGLYPEPVSHPERDYRLWQASYVQTYLERDVRNLRNLGDLTQFQVFLRALAARSAQVLNLSDLARDVGVAVNTAKDGISILEASFQIIILRPYFANIGKRLIKSLKIYFTDPGCCAIWLNCEMRNTLRQVQWVGRYLRTWSSQISIKPFCIVGWSPPCTFGEQLLAVKWM